MNKIINILIISGFLSLAACGGGGGGGGGSDNNGRETSSSGLLTGIPVAVFEQIPLEGDTLLLQEVNSEYISTVDSSVNTNGGTYYLAPSQNIIDNKGSFEFTPGYFISDSVVCLSTIETFAEVRINVTFAGETNNDILLRGCGTNEVDFTEFDSADLIPMRVSLDLTSEPSLAVSFNAGGPQLTDVERALYNSPMEYLAQVDIAPGLNQLRAYPFFPTAFFFGAPLADDQIYVEGFLERTSGHFCVPESFVGGYMMAYFSGNNEAVTMIGERVILSLFADGDSLNPEAMFYLGANCQ